MHDAADDREMNIIALCRPIQQRVPRRRLPRHQRCGRVGAIAEEIAFAINMNARREGGWVRHDPVDRGIGQPRKAHGAGFDLLTLLCPFPRDAFCERQRGGCQQGTSGRSNWAAVESYAKAFVLRNSGGFRVETFHGLTSSFPPRRIENGRESPQLSSRCGGRRAPGAGKKAGYDDGLEHADAGDDCAHDLRLLARHETEFLEHDQEAEHQDKYAAQTKKAQGEKALLRGCFSRPLFIGHWGNVTHARLYGDRVRPRPPQRLARLPSPTLCVNDNPNRRPVRNRKSTRERGCQYVEITTVAVTLKTNNKQPITYQK